MQRLLTGNEWILQLIHKIYKESGKRRGKGWGGVGGAGGGSPQLAEEEEGLVVVY
jgi:hypothetical protein